MTLIAKILADHSLQCVFGALDGQGEEVRIAGGAVRDALLGKMPAEIDLATTALPEEIIRRANAAGMKSVPTGITHGTVTVLANGRSFEVTTLRRDVETDGRHAVVAFGRDWAEDAHRRDFTLNGLFLDREGQVHDFVGGQADLAARRVRFIGDARTRIREDYLRILRFFRFFAAYGAGDPDPDALSAAIAERRGLDLLSRERIRAELLKFLIAPRAAEVAEMMSDAGFFGFVLGGMARPRRLRRLAALEAALELQPDPVLRLGALGLFIAENVERLRERLRLSNEETSRLDAMANGQALGIGVPEGTLKAAIYKDGPIAYRDRILLAWADSGADAFDAAWRQVFSLPARWKPPKFPITAKSFLDRGVEKGPKLGAALARAEEAWIAADFPDDGEALERLIARALS